MRSSLPLKVVCASLVGMCLQAGHDTFPRTPFQCLDLSWYILYVFTFHILFNVSISVLWHVYRVYIMMDRARHHGIYQEIWETSAQYWAIFHPILSPKMPAGRETGRISPTICIFSTVKNYLILYSVSKEKLTKEYEQIIWVGWA